LAARPRLLGVVAVVVAVVAASLALLIPTGEPLDRSAANPSVESASPTPTAAGLLKDTIPSPAPSSAPGPRTLAAGPVTVDPVGFFSWALFDERGQISGSTNITHTSWVGSVLNVWIVSDFLRRTAAGGRKPYAAQLTQARRAIRDDDERAVEQLYWSNGGPAQLRRMVSICKLTDTTIGDSRWRSVEMSARDTVRLGRCVADGRAAGPSWTKWGRAEMTKVRGTTADADQPSGGRWGIIDGLPADLVATGVGIKNGWFAGPGGNWQVNCLAVGDKWSLAVLMRYPAGRGLRYGAETCAQVASQLVTPTN